jgi:DNA polymerase III delta prime subunit
MLPLPIPEPWGRIQDLQKFVNLSGSDFCLFCGALASIYNVFGNYFTIVFSGPPGSGKTTATRIVRALTDPHAMSSKRYSGVRNMFPGNSHIIALENVSEITPELSDTICAINTGATYAERKLYAQGVEHMAKLHCPVIINGIPGNLADRGDLADRSVTFTFSYLAERSRSDDALWRNFNATAPKLFGAVLDGIVAALKVRQQYGDDNDAAAEDLLGDYRPRYVDAVVWAEAACRRMGFAPGEFVEAYKDNRLHHKRWINATALDDEAYQAQLRAYPEHKHLLGPPPGASR